ncbi:hypothetical protein EXN61_21785 [Agrobacterium tumefaciens]|uniref:Uncharacterized protein n=1 Tax=Agrobacterium tumefaciens TaxID=358 RepID=A0A546XRW7_AGRTU|nr:hypothetical protein [Agrobacterium tumefaciens]TRB03495.1 hypothetical protein EXN61_21785 [Agrobacterium tumefaciens]
MGDIILFKSEVAGKAKYHFCFYFDNTNDVYSLMFLNSEGIYADHFAVDCSRIPELPASRSGSSVFSCPTVIRKKTDQLAKLEPEKKCTLPRDVAIDFLVFAKTITSMTENDKARLIATLEVLSA